MTDSLTTLIDQLEPENDWPEPELLTAIAAQSEAAVPLLCARLADPDYEGWTLHYAANLLAVIGLPSSIPALVNTFRLYDTDFLESTADALSAFGEAAIEPALTVARDPKLNWYQRSMAINAAVDAAGNDPALRAQVAAALRDMLAEFLARRDLLTEDDTDLVGSIVADLSNLADPEARAIINAAFEADIVNTDMIDRQDVKRDYERGGLPGQRFEPQAWLADYSKSYQRHLENEARRMRDLERERRKRPVVTTPVGTPRLGRNESCWCGSGKKYKKCHLQSDLQGG